MKLKTAIGIREIGAVVLGLLVLALGYFSWKGYQEEASLDIRAVSGSEPEESGLVLEEMASLMDRSKTPAGRYQIVEERNLFNTSRTAWQPPKPKPPQPKEEEPEEKQPTAPPPRGNEVQFFGSFAAGDKVMAIVKVPMFRTDKKEFIVSEGDTLKDPSGTHKQTYEILSISREALEVRNSDGYTFVAGLLDRQRRGPNQTVNTTNILTEKQPEAPKSVVSTVAKPEQQAQKAAPKPAASAQSADGLPSNWHSLPDAEKDALVKQGKLTKMITPFGPSYGPVKK